MQGDSAESFCILYQGSISVHLWKEPEPVKEMRKIREKMMQGPVIRNKGDLLEVLPDRIGTRVGILNQGNSFGENGMDPSGSAKRSATCVAVREGDEPTILLELSRHDLMTTDAPAPPPAGGFAHVSFALVTKLKVPPSERTEADVAFIDDAVGWHPFLAPLDPASRLTIVKCLTLQAFDKDRVIMLQEDKADAFYITRDARVLPTLARASGPRANSDARRKRASVLAAP